ncbi:MAG: ABC transporter ATP-binding protein [archaeon]|nr:ABC transporter ATP-binding protein [archaeon]
MEDGDFVGIIGPNGSGKSTTLKAIYRTLKPTGGEVYIMGENILNVSMRESALKTAVVAQHNYYNFDFSVMDVVMMGRAPHKQAMERDNEDDRRIACESLDKIGMLEFADRNFYTLSGGEQQRVILARALTQQTPFLILDEPTNHLDIKYQLQLMDTIKDLEGLTVLCALHDLNIASQYCNKLILMKDGSIHSIGTPEEILTPETIKEVYGVDVTVEHNADTGLMNIVYHPNFKKGRKV